MKGYPDEITGLICSDCYKKFPVSRGMPGRTPAARFLDKWLRPDMTQDALGHRAERHRQSGGETCPCPRAYPLGHLRHTLPEGCSYHGGFGSRTRVDRGAQLRQRRRRETRPRRRAGRIRRVLAVGRLNSGAACVAANNRRVS